MVVHSLPMMAMAARQLPAFAARTPVFAACPVLAARTRLPSAMPLRWYTTTPSTDPSAAASAPGSSHHQGACAPAGDLPASELRELLQVAVKDQAELREQVAQLTQGLQALNESVEKLQAKNLIERYKTSAERDTYSDRPNRWSGTRWKEFRPTKEMVRNPPTHICHMDNQTLAELAQHGMHAAHTERLLREIMEVDKVTWDKAHDILGEIDVYNERYYWIESLPYRVGITVAFICLIMGYAMVFNKTVAYYYGTMVAGEDLPEGVESVSELTVNQVGAWTWNWMEPMIGTGCFVLLCCQFIRTQMWKLNMSPYTEAMLRYRANRLADRFPQYDRTTVRMWAKHLPMVGHDFWPTYRRYARH